MIELLVATSNQGKKKEVEEYLKRFIPDITFISLSSLKNITEPEEDSIDFWGNSVKKSVYYSSKAKGIITMADDSGLSVDSLGGRPGVNSSRYSGPECDDKKNIEKLLKELSGEKRREAKFITVITLSLNGKIIKSFRGEVQGVILNEKRGSGGFGYDSVFFYPPLKKTFAELTVKEKNKISHRAKALEKMKNFLVDFKH